jgi:hypothetical protein
VVTIILYHNRQPNNLARTLLQLSNGRRTIYLHSQTIRDKMSETDKITHIICEETGYASNQFIPSFFWCTGSIRCGLNTKLQWKKKRSRQLSPQAYNMCMFAHAKYLASRLGLPKQIPFTRPPTFVYQNRRGRRSKL